MYRISPDSEFVSSSYVTPLTMIFKVTLVQNILVKGLPIRLFLYAVERLPNLPMSNRVLTRLTLCRHVETSLFMVVTFICYY